MPRIRSTHPSQWTDENFVQCSFAARLLVISVRNETDDNGIFEWKPKTLKMKLFAADNIDVEPLLDELVETKQVMKFEVNGVSYGMVRNFQKYQRPEKPKFLYPVPSILPTGYALNVRYSANNTGDKKQESPQGQQPVGDQSAKVNSEGTGTGKGIVHSSELVRTNSSECEGAHTNFQNLVLEGEYLEKATNAGVLGESASRCWEKWKLKRASSPPAEPLADWGLWVLNEFKRPNEPPAEVKLSVEEALIHVLGATNWKRKAAKTNASLAPKASELKTLVEWEAKNGAVTWDNLGQWREQQKKTG